MSALADLVTVARRFRRSVRVDADVDAQAAQGFICTPTAAQALRTVASHVHDHGHGAFTWTGSYGCGKSSLAVVLGAVLGPDGAARRNAAAVLPAGVLGDVERGFSWRKKGWKVVAASGRRADAADVISAALDREGVPPAGDDLVERLLTTAASEPCGLLLIIDEMGKLLEHAATAEGDAFLFQSMAEAASRSDGKLVLIGILHQAFDDYAYRLARETRDDWLKIQGRFVDVPLNPAGEEQLGLLAAAIGAEPPATLPPAEAVARAMRGDEPAAADLANVLRGCWPLSPVVAAILGPLSRRRFGQNQRSLFGFLSSAEPYAFQDFLFGTASDAPALYDTDWLWKYLRSNLEPSILASPDGHRWSLALDAIERCEARGADELQLRVAKAVALTDMFRERSGMVASLEILAAAIPDQPTASIEAALATLAHWSILIHRRHLGGYSLYAGSDFDIEAALRDALGETSTCDYARLRGTGVFGPVLAKRHYHETGAMRWFEVDVAPLDLAEERIDRFQGDSGAVGLFLLLVNEGGASRENVRRRLASLGERIGDRAIAIGVPFDSYMLREVSLELIALEKMLSARPELRGDAVARREVASRATRSAAELEERLRSSLASTDWLIPGYDLQAAPSGAGRLSVLASELASRIFDESPTVSNELVNRSRPSSNAAAAVRSLMVAMVGAGAEPGLGFESFPPERGLYVSILEQAGVHGPLPGGGYGFRRPAADGDSSRLLPIWGAADRALEECGADGLTLDRLYATWMARPYGVKRGLLPILALAYLLSEQTGISCYLDGTFCPAIGDLFVDRLLQDPDAVRLRQTLITPHHAEILAGVAGVTSRLLGRPATATSDPLTVGRELVAVISEAPVWTRRTGSLSRQAAQVRNVALGADDPNKFMLDDLPRMFDLAEGTDTPERLVTILSAGLDEIASAYPRMLERLVAGMLGSLDAGNDDGNERLRLRAEDVVGLTGNYRLDAFANRLRAFDGTIEAIEGLASLAANKPPRDWVDRDVDQARLELAALSEEFLRAEALAHVKDRPTRQIRMAIYVSDPNTPSVRTSEFTVDDLTRQRARQLAGKLMDAMGDDMTDAMGLAAVVELAALLEKRTGKSERSDAPKARAS